MFTKQTRQDAFGRVVREQSSRERQVIRMRALGSERFGEHVDEIRFGARRKVTDGRKLFFDRTNFVREAKQIQTADVARCNQRKRRPGSSCTTGASRAMQIRFRILWEVVVDDVRDVRDVDAPCSNIGRDEEAQFALARRRHDSFAIVLLHVAVEPIGIETLTHERACNDFSLVLRVAEDDRALGVLHLDDASKRAEFVRRNHEDEVADREGADVITGQGDELGRAQFVARNALDVWGKCGGKKKCLSIRRQPLEDGGEFTLEAHRQHLVALIEDEQANVFGVERAAAKMIEHAARCADDDLSTASNGVDLLGYGRATVDGDDTNTLSFA